MIWLLVGFILLVVLAVAWWHTGRNVTEPVPLRTWRVGLPRDADFSVAKATAWFSSLAPRLRREPPWPSVELRGENRELHLLITAPADWEEALRAQLAAWFPEARLDDHSEDAADPARYAVPLRLRKSDLYPIRIPDPREPDPLLGIIGSLTQSELTRGVRITWGPSTPDWRWWAPAALVALKNGTRLPPRGVWFWVFAGYLFLKGSGVSGGQATRASANAAPTIAGAATKAQAPVFSVRLTVWAADRIPETARERVGDLARQLEVTFRDPFGNCLIVAGQPRLHAAPERSEPAIALSAAELATLFHLPGPAHRLVPRGPSRLVPPSPTFLRTLTDQTPITWLGEALTPEGPVPFGLAPAERRLHAYIVGKTGAGKSTLLATILKQDLERGRGVGIIDPHGALAEKVLAYIPPERYDQVLYFNPADTGWPVGFNLLAARTAAERPLVASGVISLFKKLYSDSWGPRLEHFLRQTILALLECPSPSLLLIPRFLTDRAYRERLLTGVHDPLVRTFFEVEFPSYDPRWRAEALSPILNKVGQFLASPVVRHIVGQSALGINLRRVMDDGKIVIANLASGHIGEDNADLLGALLVAGFQIAAMARADQPEESRQPYYLTVDEFQHFTTDSFVTILSEARKYGLCLTLAHQYLDQLAPSISDAVLGNAASLCVFRVGASDTARLTRELAPSFDGQDLIHLPNYHFCARLAHTGGTIPAFSARTVPLPDGRRNPGVVIEQSRRRFARPRSEVETEIADLWEGRLD